MVLTGPNGSKIELTIVGYEFPNITDQEYDADWLRVRVKVKSPQGCWEASDPCLLTWEARQLSGWLERVARGLAAGGQENFMEPVMSFKVVGTSPEAILLKVCFSLELNPPWMKGRVADYFCVDLQLTPEQIKEAAKALREQLESFPVRLWPKAWGPRS